MSNRIELTDAAKQDLRDIWRGLAEYGQLSIADEALRGIESKFELLCQFPGAGRSRNEFFPGLRSYPSDDFVIFYRFSSPFVEIIRVLHGRRDLPAIFQEFP